MTGRGDQQQFVAADPGDGVAGKRDVPQRIRSAADELVARGVTLAFVDLAKAVEVDENDSRWRAPGKQRAVGHPSVACARQRVSARIVRGLAQQDGQDGHGCGGEDEQDSAEHHAASRSAGRGSSRRLSASRSHASACARSTSKCAATP